jgi:hypothetical protein
MQEIDTNVWRLCEVAELEAQMFNLAQMFYRIPMLKLAPIPQFCKTVVIASFVLFFFFFTFQS